MLNRDYKLFILIIILFIFISCKKNKEDFSVEDITHQDLLYKQTSKSIIKNQYNSIYKKGTDSLLQWKNSKLDGFKDLQLYPFKLDSLICFNQNKNKMVGAVLVSDKNINKNKGDGITFFYGVKIKEQWYFFTGADIVLPREFYQKDIHKPLSFQKLHEIAIEEVFRGYLIQNSQGKWVVNNAFFDNHFKGSGWGCGHVTDKGWVDTCSEKEFEELYYQKSLSNWKE